MIKRLGKIINKASIKIHLSASCNCICGKHYKMSISIERFTIIFDYIQCLYAIRLRHHMIHKYKVIFLLFTFFYSSRTTAAKIRLDSGSLKKKLENRKVGSVIINCKNICKRCIEIAFILINIIYSLLSCSLSDWSFIKYSYWNINPELGTNTVFTFNTDASVH